MKEERGSRFKLVAALAGCGCLLAVIGVAAIFLLLVNLRSETNQADTIEHGLDQLHIISFDTGAQGLGLPSIPVRVVLPDGFELGPDPRSPNTNLWTTPVGHEHLRQRGFVSPHAGAVQFREGTGVAFDAATNSFSCGRDCGERELEQQMRDGATGVSFERTQTEGGVPALLIEADSPAVGSIPASRAYLIYLGASDEGLAVLYSWTPSPYAKDQVGVWSEMKRVVLGRMD